MIKEHLINYQISVFVSIILSIIGIMIDIRISNAILLGTLTTFIYRFWMSYNMGTIIKSGNSSKLYGFSLWFVSFLVLLVSFVITFLLPNTFSYIGLFIGLMIEKVIFIIMNIRG